MSSSTFVKSTLILTVATLLSKIFGSVYKIPLQNIAGDEVLGIFTAVYPVYMVALYLSVAGIPLAISKLIADANARGESHKVHKIYRTASILALCLGVLGFAFISGFSSFLAGFMGGSNTQYALIIVSLTLLVAPSMAIYRGFFQGYGDMKPTAISQVIEQLVRAVLIIIIAVILVKLGYSNKVVAGGVMVGSIVGVLGSLVFLRWRYQKSPHKVVKTERYTMNHFKEYSSTILKISIPIAIGSVAMALFNFVDSFTIPAGLKAAGVDASQISHLFGVYGRGVTLVQITTVFASSIILPLVPLITEKLVARDTNGTRAVIEQTQKMTHLISWPAALGLFALTVPLNIALFTNTEGSLMLAVINFSAVFTSLTLLGTGILQGLNLARLGAFIILGGVVIKVLANLLFISRFGLEGAAYSTLLVYVVIFIANTVFIYRKLKFTFLTPAIVKMVIASLVMAAVIGLPTVTIFDAASWSRLVALLYVLVAIGVGAIIYFAILWFTKAINNSDLRKLPVIGKKIQAKQDAKKPAAMKEQVVATPQQAVVGASTPPTSTQRERKNFMPKQKWLWGIIIALLLIATPSIADRWTTEQHSDQFEIMMPFEELQLVDERTERSMDEIIQTLKDKGLSNVSLSPVTLESLMNANIVHVYEENELEKQLRFTDDRNVIDTKNMGLYVSVPEEQHYRTLLEETIDPDFVTVAGQDFYFISDATSDYRIDTPIGYDTKAIELLTKYDLNYTFRVKNAPTEEINHLLVKQLVELKTDHANGLLPEGSEMIGFNQSSGNAFLYNLYDAGYYFYFIEGAEMKGGGMTGKIGNYDVIRLHSVDINRNSNYTAQTMAEVTVRAVKERNIRSMFFHVKKEGKMEDNFQNALLYFDKVSDQMPDRFTMGEPTLFEKYTVPTWALAAVLLAGILFIFLAAELLMIPLLQYVAAAFMAVLAVAYFALDRTLFLQAFALIVAVAAPAYAVIKHAHGSHKISTIFVRYVKAAAITIVGIWIVVGLLNGNKFITGYEVFRGVILVYLIPIFVVLLHVLLKLANINIRHEKDSVHKIGALLNAPVRYWHTVLLVVVVGVVFFYVGRTGNSGFAPGFELAFRQWLEETFYVRPRTKEFLIGFPFFVLALYVLKSNKHLGRILLIPAVIGFLSIMNTFTHLHIPLDVSVLRTVYGLILGFVIGLVLIVIYKGFEKIYARLAKRWS